ncbi:MAG: hypothetical protein GX258_01725 [Clostridiales bacterium]|mgnify:CR=1 FL=1|nr:hypothetical protein [Clostridiales bacterium]
MVLKNNYGKEFIIVDDKEFIYNGRLRKRTIKKSDIRSVFYDDRILGVLTYRGKVYSFSLKPLLSSERSRLEELRQELAKENILFNYTRATTDEFFIYFLLINSILTNWGRLLIQVLFLVLIIILFICKSHFYTKIVFNIDKDQFEIIRRNSTIKYKKYEIDKINFRKYTNKIYIIEFDKDRKKYNFLFKENPYLIKIYNTSFAKLFNKDI